MFNKKRKTNEAQGTLFNEENAGQKLYVSRCVLCKRLSASPDPLVLARWEEIHLKTCIRVPHDYKKSTAA